MRCSLKSALDKNLPKTSFALLGLGVLLAWNAVVQTLARTIPDLVYGRSVLMFDMGSVPVFLFFLVAARRFAPLSVRKRPLALGIAFMLAAAGCMVAAYLLPNHARLVAQIGLVLAGCGSSISALHWWESYAVLKPTEVAFYYAGSWIVREAVLVLLAGYSTPYLLAFAAALPILSVALFQACSQAVRSQSLGAPRANPTSSSLPWKPMTLVALYAFAYGCGTWILFYEDNVAMHLGMLLPALIVCASVALASARFNFTVVYRIILPAAIAGFLALLFVQGLGTSVATLFVRASYTAVLIYVSVLLCNLSRRYLIDAPWLFSLFNIVHIAFLGIGTLLFNALPAMAIVGTCIACIVFTTFIIISEPSLDSDWKVIFIDKGGDAAEFAQLQALVESLGRQHGLSERQREILLLLARKETPRSIAHSLSISPGTVKAHVQHIYRKLGIHSREELDALVRK